MFVRQISVMIRAGVLTTAVVCSVATAQNTQDSYAVVTALGGGGAKRVGGEAFLATKWRSGHEPVLNVGVPLVTVADGTAVLLLPGHETVVHLGGGEGETELTLDDVPALAGQVPIGLSLASGRALIVQDPGYPEWLLVAWQTGGSQGYALARGAMVVVEIVANDVTVAVSQGTVVFFPGLPGAELVDDRGRLLDGTGVTISPGQRRSMTAPATPVPDTDSVPLAAQGLGATVYAFGLTKGEQWVKLAEEGDFVPAGGAAVRGVTRALSEEVGVPPPTFDQARPPTIVSSTRVTIAPTTASFRAGMTGNVALSFATSRNPGDAVFGQRLLRTRIIGNPGTTGGIRFNPDAEPLIRLAGTPAR